MVTEKCVVANFAEKHGPPPGRGAVVVAMGSLGAGRLNAASDLDLIVIYDGSDAEASEGRRSLATRPYYARLTQALVTALSAPSAEGRLDEVDMRLRPSGRQGPVATALSSFKRYQTEEAWTWEHLALTRARPLAGDGAVGDDVESFRQELLGRPRDRSAILADVAAMRARLAEARPANDALDVKTGPGRLQDIELYAEAGALLAGNPKRRIGQQLTAAAEVFHLSDADRQMVKSVADLYWRVQASARLVAGIGSLDAASAGAGASAFLIRETGAASLQDLEQRLAESARSVQTLIDKMIGTAPGSD